MKHLNIDIETYSEVDITSSGAYKYVEDPAFEVLMFAYSIDFGDVQIVDLMQGEILPDEIIKAMADDEVIKHAYNASFEYNALLAAGYDVGSRCGWRCSMFHAMYLGYPGGLAKTGNAIGLPQDKKKDSAGKALINYFSKPCKPTKVNGGRLRNLPHHDLDKWEMFKDYCKQDVVAEMEIYKRLSIFPVPDIEQRLWELSDSMNALGVKVDVDLVNSALSIDDESSDRLIKRAKEVTGIDNPKSTSQVLNWLQERVDGVENTNKETVASLLSRDDIPGDVREFLKIRQELAKASISKYKAMDVCRGSGDRVRGLLQVYGANRTGRWAGRLVQVQNLPRNYLDNLETIRDVIKTKNLDLLQLVCGNASDTLSQLIRTAFIPTEGNKFVVADYSAIEARVVAWLAGEEWVNKVFATHGKIYEATASQMFGVPFELIKKGNPEYELRQRGKVATLALGYQGGVGALVAMGADKMGLSEDEMTEIVDKWRGANPNIVKLWHGLNQACIKALQTGKDQEIRGLRIRYECEAIYGQSFLTIQLPSGRKLFYPKPYIKDNQFDKPAIHFFSQKNTKWYPESTYGGKLTENCVQAIARDCLADLLIKLDSRLKSHPVVMHIHDEVVLDAGQDLTLDEVCRIMAEPVGWAPGLVLKGAGFESEFYMKD